jgi:hypothetical protein
MERPKVRAATRASPTQRYSISGGGPQHDPSDGAATEGEVTRDEWEYVESNLISIHARLEVLWSAAWEQHKAEHRAHEEALEDAKARTAAPSEADIERAEALRHLLRSAATVALRQCKEAMPAEKLIRLG